MGVQRSRWRTAWAFALGSCIVMLVAAAVALAAVNGVSPWSLSYLLFVTACAVAGAVIVGQQPSNVVGGLLLVSAASFAALEASGQYAVLSLRHPDLIGGGVAAWPQNWLWIPANLAICLLPLYFPTGRAEHPVQVWASRAVTGLGALAMVVAAGRPGANSQQSGPVALVNPWGWEPLAASARIVDTAVGVLGAVVFVAGALDLVRRATRHPGPTRARLKWVGYAAGLAALVICARFAAGLLDDHPGPWPAADTAWELLGALGVALLPVAIGVAIVRHRLFDIDLAINRTVVYLIASALVAAGYLGLATYLGSLLGRQSTLAVSAAAAIVVAIAFAPVRTAVQTGVDRVMYGVQPYEVLRRLGRTVEAAPAAADVLPAVATMLQNTLRLSFVEIRAAGRTLARVGQAPREVRPVALVSHGTEVGELLIWPPPGWLRRDRRLLADLGPPLASTVMAVQAAAEAERLAAELRLSRAQLVLSGEEERRRIRRDLHDGLGPALASLGMRAEALAETGDPDRARALATRIADDARLAVGDLRRLVDGLRPPALDSVGLVAALRSHLEQFPEGPRSTVTVAGDLTGLPAAVEVAVYRIATEAATNARRHADAARVDVRLTRGTDGVTLEVSDDGRGFDSVTVRRGVGLVSMRERTEQLGGVCVVHSGPGGTSIRATLPLGTLPPPATPSGV